MADISTLGIKIDSSQIEKTIKSLDKLAESAAKVESATSKIAATMGAYIDSTKSAGNEESKRQKSIDKMIESLRQQNIIAEKGISFFQQYKLANLGASDSEIKYAKILQESTEAHKKNNAEQKMAIKAANETSSANVKRQSDISRIIKTLKEEEIRLSAGKTALVDYKLSLLNATEAERKQAKALSEKIQLMQDANKKSIDASDIMSKLATRVSALVAAYFGISAIKNFANEILETAKIADNFKYSLLAVSDSSEQAAETYKYLEKEANRLGQSITGNVDAFTGFMAAAKAANMTTEQAKKAYTGLNEAMTALHRTPEQASQALYALQQMLSTGTVRAQELNIQLGNAIPGAVPMFAQALGKTTSELRDMMQKGLVPANESVIQFTDYLSNKFAPSAEAASDSVQGNLNKMDNAVYNLKKAIVEALGDNTTGIIKQFTEAIKEVTESLSKPETQAQLKKYADAILAIGKAFKWAGDLAADYIEFFADPPMLANTEMHEAARLAKKDLIEYNRYQAAGYHERQVMVKGALKLEADQQKSQQETIKNQKELLKTISDTSIETKNAGDAFNRGWSPIVGTTAEITDQMKENEKTIKSITEKLQEQAITAGKTGVEKVRAELEAANATDEEKKAILALAAANEQKENARKNAEKAQRKAEQDAEAAIRKAEAAEKARQGSIDKIIDKLKQQIAAYNEGKEVLAAYQLKLLGATDDEIKLAKSLGKTIDDLKNKKELQEEYNKVIEQTTEKTNELSRANAIAVITKAMQDGLITFDQYKKDLEQVNTFFDKLDMKESDKTINKLTDALEDLTKVDGRSFGNELADGINNAMISMMDFTKTIENNEKAQKKLEALQKEIAKGKGSPEEREQALKDMAVYEENMTKNSLKSYRQLFGTISQLYGENTKEREALHKIEMAFAAAEIAMNLQKTISAAYYAMANSAGGDPYTAFARVAAMTALMAGIVSAAGGSLSGGGSGGGAASAAASTSSSTVLGSTEGSQSISNSLDFMTDIQSKQYNELKGINDGVESLNKNITGLVTSIVRTGGVSSVSGAVAGTSGGTSYAQDSLVRYSSIIGIATSISSDLMKNVPIIGNLLGNIAGFVDDAVSGISNAVFGGSKKTTILAQGLEVSTGKISDLLGGMGADIQKFADIKVEKEGGLFGSDKTYYKTLYESLGDENVSKMFTNVFKNMGETMVAISKGLNLGEDNIEAIYAYTFDIGKIDLKGLETSEDINAALTEAINKAGDVAIQDLFGELIGKYQEVGEGLLETAIRVVSEKGVVEDILSMTNQAFDNAAIPEIALATTQSIIDLAGGIKQLQESSSTYFNEFFDDAEKQSRLYSQLSGAMASINLPMAENRDAFRAMVESLDLNTESGREQYVTMLNLSEAADKYYDTLESGEKTTKDNSDAITSMVTDTQKAIDQMDMSEFDKSIQNIKDNTEKSIKQLTDMGASESDLAVIREYGNKQIKELTDAQNQQIADEKDASASLRASKQLELDILNGVATEQDKVNFQRQQELKTLPESVQAIQQAIWAKEDEIAANEKAAKIASEKSALELRIDELTMSSSDFLAKKRLIELAAMDDTLRPLQQRIYQLEDEASANAKAAEIADKRQSLEIELLNLTGKSTEAVALQRKIELASLDDSLKPLQERVWALQDEAATTGNVNENITKKYELEIRLLELTGKTAEATAIKREKELVGLDATNKDLQKRIWALEDEAEAIQKATEIANERKNLEIQLLELEGKSKEAVALQRQLELASIDDSNKALQERIWLLQDEKEEADAAKAAADQLAEQQKQYQEQVLSERIGLENELLQLMGNTDELRRRELESLDASNRSLQQRIWALQDEQELNDLVSNAKNQILSTQKSLETELLTVLGDTNAIREQELESLRNGGNAISERLSLLKQEEQTYKDKLDSNQKYLEEWSAIDEKYHKDIVDRNQEKYNLELKASKLLREASVENYHEKMAEYKLVRQQIEAIDDKASVEKRSYYELYKYYDQFRLENEKLEGSVNIVSSSIEQLEKAMEDTDTSILESLQKQIWAAEEAKKISEEKASLEIQLAKLTLSDAEYTSLIREQELAKIYDSNKAIQERIWLLEDEKKASDAQKQAVEESIGILKESIDKQIEYYQKIADAANEALETARGVLDRSFQAEQESIIKSHESLIESLTARLDDAKNAASSLEYVFNSLSSARKSMEGSIAKSYKTVQAQLFSALESARTGDLSQASNLIPDLNVLTGNTQDLFASEQEYKRNFYKNYAALLELENISGEQLSDQQLIIKNLEGQINQANEQHEIVMAQLQNQYDAVIGVDKSVMRFEDAVKNYQKAQYEADGANTLLKQQTDYLNSQLNILTGINTEIISVEEAINNLKEAQNGTSSAIISQSAILSSISSSLSNICIPAQESQHTVIPGYANGGMASGTYVVGERGPEMLTTPPAKITSNTEIKSMLNDEDVKRILAEIKEEISRGNFNIAKNTQETAKTLKKFDYDGMPETRV